MRNQRPSLIGISLVGLASFGLFSALLNKRSKLPPKHQFESPRIPPIRQH